MKRNQEELKIIEKKLALKRDPLRTPYFESL